VTELYLSAGVFLLEFLQSKSIRLFSALQNESRASSVKSMFQKENEEQKAPMQCKPRFQQRDACWLLFPDG